VIRRHFHVPPIGHDAITFYVQVWRFIRFRCERFRREEGHRHGLTRHRKPRVYWLESNGVIIAPYRLQNGEGLDDSYPRNRLGAAALAQLNIRHQYELFGDEALEEMHGLPAALVLAHQGDPNQECTGVHLMEPVAVTDGRISRWRYTETLWVPGHQLADVPQAVPVGPVPVEPKPLAKPEGSD
jgi:hypothetical protein